MRFDLAKTMNATRLAAVCVLIALAGCAGMGQRGTPEEQVKARAQLRQDALVKGDLERAYQYFTPAYRTAVTAQSYRGSIGKALVMVAGTVESVECETLEKCVAKVKVETKPLVNPRFTATITTYGDETWLLEAGQWWFFQKL